MSGEKNSIFYFGFEHELVTSLWLIIYEAINGALSSFNTIFNGTP
jgi:hypothetical protein